MKKAVSLILALAMIVAILCVPATADYQVEDYDPVGQSLAATVSPYLEEGGFESEENFLTIDDFASHVITFINIWSDGCGPRIAEMPYFQQIHEEYGDQGVLVVGGVTTWIQGNFATEYQYLQSHGYTYMNVIPDTVLHALYNHNSYVPQTFIVNSEGIVVDFIGGGTTYATLVSKINYWFDIYGGDHPDHTVTFVDGVTNEVIETQTVQHAHAPVYPEAPEHEGYTFTAWDPANVAMVLEDMTITATYTASVFRVRFYDSITGEKLSTQYVIYGHAVNPPTPPEHPGYEFVGWDHDLSFISAPVDIYTIYQPTGAQMGDIDGDGALTANDALMILRHALGITTLDAGVLGLADVDGNGNVDANDALLTLRMALGLAS